MRIKRLLAVALFIVLMLAVSACGNKAEDAKSSKSGKKTEDVKSKEDTTITSSITVDDILQQITEKNDDGATSAPATNTTPASAVPTTTEAPRNNDDLSDDGAPEPEPTEVVTPEPTVEPTLAIVCPYCNHEVCNIYNEFYQCTSCFHLYTMSYGTLYDCYGDNIVYNEDTNSITMYTDMVMYDYENPNKLIDTNRYVNINMPNDNIIVAHTGGMKVENAVYREPDCRIQSATIKYVQPDAHLPYGYGISISVTLSTNTSTNEMLEYLIESYSTANMEYDTETNIYTFMGDNTVYFDTISHSVLKLYTIKTNETLVFILFNNAGNTLSNEDLLSQVIEPMLADIEYEPYVIEQ